MKPEVVDRIRNVLVDDIGMNSELLLIFFNDGIYSVHYLSLDYFIKDIFNLEDELYLWMAAITV